MGPDLVRDLIRKYLDPDTCVVPLPTLSVRLTAKQAETQASTITASTPAQAQPSMVLNASIFVNGGVPVFTLFAFFVSIFRHGVRLGALFCTPM